MVMSSEWFCAALAVRPKSDDGDQNKLDDDNRDYVSVVVISARVQQVNHADSKRGKQDR
jgi:hypothetical protein